MIYTAFTILKYTKNEKIYFSLKFFNLTNFQNAKIMDLIKISSGIVLMIKFKMDSVDFDISFVAIPRLKSLPQKLDNEFIEKYVIKFDNANPINLRMLRSFSSNFFFEFYFIKKLFE